MAGLTLGDGAIQTVLKFQGRVVALQLEQVVAGRDLDQDRHAAPGSHRQHQHGNLDIQHREAPVLKPQPLVFHGCVPLHQLNHQLDLLLLAHRRHTEEVLDVDDPQAPDLHVVLDDGRPMPHCGVGLALHVHDVVCHQPVAAQHQIQRTLALADAALAEDQDAHAQDVEQHPVQAGAGRERILQEALDVHDEHRRELLGAQERHCVGVGDLDQEIGNLQVLGHAQGRDVRAEKRLAGLPLLLGRQRRQEAHLGVAEHLQALQMQVIQEARQRQARLLHT